MPDPQINQSSNVGYARHFSILISTSDVGDMGEYRWVVQWKVQTSILWSCTRGSQLFAWWNKDNCVPALLVLYPAYSHWKREDMRMHFRGATVHRLAGILKAFLYVTSVSEWYVPQYSAWQGRLVRIKGSQTLSTQGSTAYQGAPQMTPHNIQLSRFMLFIFQRMQATYKTNSTTAQPSPLHQTNNWLTL